MRNFINIITESQDMTPAIDRLLTEVESLIIASGIKGDPALIVIQGLIHDMKTSDPRLTHDLEEIEHRLTDYLMDNTEEVFEELPEIDDARSAVQEFLENHV
jgi:hypothetical protein